MEKLSLLKKLILVLFLSLLASNFASAETIFQVAGVTAPDTLNFRSGPSSKTGVVARLPYNGKFLRPTGKTQQVGRTLWVQVKWQGITGWVSKAYIRVMTEIPSWAKKAKTAAPAAVPTARVQVAQRAAAPAPAQRVQAAPPPPRPATVQRTQAVPGSKGQWVLECGARSPFWRVIVHPKALEVNLRGFDRGLLPITFEHQQRNKWNTAMRTELRSSNGYSVANMEIKYVRQCMHTLTGQKTPYRVQAIIDRETVSGCCRAVRLR